MRALRLLAFFSGQLGVMCLARFFFAWVLRYADQRDGSGEALFVAATVGLVFLGARVFDGVLDPIIGRMSDAYVARGGKRARYLWYSGWSVALGLVLSFAPSLDQPPLLRWALLLAGFLVFFVGYTFYSIPLWSLVDDFGGDDRRERATYSNLLGMGLLAAVAVVSVIAPMVIQSVGYARAALYFAVPATILMALPPFAEPPGGVTHPPRADVVAAHQSGLSAMLAALRHRRFAAVLALFCGSQMALTTVNVASPFIAERLLGGTEADVAKLMGPFLGTALPCFALVPWASRRIGWEKAMLGATLGLAAVYLGVSALGSSLIGSPMTTAMLVFGAGGPMVAVLLGLEGEAVAACAREAGGAQVSLYFGIFNMWVKALNGVATFVTGVLVTVSSSAELRVLATRGMGVSAALMLLVGSFLYFLLRPRGHVLPETA
jgi:Na+/melibiose symporter-like transporter